MTTRTTTHTVRTRGFCDILDITGAVRDALRAAGVTDGLVSLFVPGSTAALTTIEYEEGAVADLRKAIERLAPQAAHYEHNARWDDGNGFAHVRAALLGPSLTVPVARSELLLGTWQQIILADFDNRPRRRDIIIQIFGEQTPP